MKWLRHDTDGEESEGFCALIHDMGFEGYGRYWRLMEIIAKKMDAHSSRCHAEYPESEWLLKLKAKRKVFKTFLELIENQFKIKSKQTGKIIRIEAPILLKKRDNYSKDLQAKSKKLDPVDKDKELDKEKDLKHSAPPKTEKKKTPQKKKDPPKKKDTNPDIKIAVDHFHDEYLRLYEVKPNISGAHPKIIEGQLKKRSLDELNLLITMYLEDREQYLVDKGHPIELFLNRINALLIRLNESKKTQKKQEEAKAEAKAREDSKVDLPELEGDISQWIDCMDGLELTIFPESYKTWFTPIKYLGQNGSMLYLAVPNEHFRKCLKDNFKQNIIENFGFGVKDIKFYCDGEFLTRDRAMA